MSGPANTYISASPLAIVGPPAPVAPIYLGVAEVTPKITVRPHFQGVFSDIGGPDIPHDWMFTGRDGMSTLDLTVYNWPVLLRSMQRPNNNLAAAFLTDLAGSIGALMNTEGFSYQVWFQFPYSTKPAFAGMIPGLRFPTSWLFGPEEFDMGTKPNKIHLQFYHARSLNQSTGDWLLGDINMAGIPAVPPSTQAGA